jgi:hypothetical protein
MKNWMMVFAGWVASSALTATVATAADAPVPSTCPKTRSADEIRNEPSCGNTPACAAKRDAELKAAQAAHECEMAKLAAAAASPVPGAATAAAVTK